MILGRLRASIVTALLVLPACDDPSADSTRPQLVKTIPAVAHFVDLGRRNYGDVRNRNQLDPGGGHGIESGKLSTGRVQCERKLLGAVAEEVAAADIVVLVKAVIDLGDKAGQ